MKNIVKGLIVAGLGLALLARPASAQKPGVELGVQLVGASMTNWDGANNNITAFNVGGASFGGAGVGAGSAVTGAFYVNNMIAIEPGLGFGYAKQEGASNSVSVLNLQVGVPIYLKRGWGKAGGLFVEPFAGMNRLSSGGTSSSQNHFGANVGTKIKMMDCFFWRAQVGVDMGLKNTTDGIPKYTAFGGSFGLSVYLH